MRLGRILIVAILAAALSPLHAPMPATAFDETWTSCGAATASCLDAFTIGGIAATTLGISLKAHVFPESGGFRGFLGFAWHTASDQPDLGVAGVAAGASLVLRVKPPAALTDVTGMMVMGSVTSWTYNAATRVLEIVGSPSSVSRAFTTTCTVDTCPPDVRADVDGTALFMIMAFQAVAGVAPAEMVDLKGGYIATNAQDFTTPNLVGGRLQFKVAGPHCKATPIAPACAVVPGHFKAFVPNAFVTSAWGGVTSDLTVTVTGQAAPGGTLSLSDATNGSVGGKLIDYSGFNYSNPTIEIGRAAAASVPAQEQPPVPETSVGEPISAIGAPIRLGLSGTIGVPVSMSGEGARLEIAAGTTVRTARGDRFSGYLQSPYRTSDPTGGRLASVYNFLATGLEAGGEVRFSQPVTITLPVSAGSDANQFQPAFVDRFGGLSYLRGRAAAGGVAFETDHLSIYGLAAIPKPAVTATAPAVPARPGYHSRWAGQSPYVELAPGQLVDLAVKFLNAGDRAWVRGTPGRQANLGSSEPLDNLRDFNAGILLTPLPGTLNRYATTDEAVVNPGEVGTFSMRLRAPTKPGVYQINFRPVVDGATWLEDDGVFLQITVR